MDYLEKEEESESNEVTKRFGKVTDTIKVGGLDSDLARVRKKAEINNSPVV